MTKKRVLIVLLLFFLAIGALAFAAGPARNDDSFGLFFRDFKKAVDTDDKEKMASLINFPNFTWEGSENLQVKTKEAFLNNYDRMFTPAVKKKITAAGKPSKVDDNTYFLNWYVKDTEYSLDFARKPDESFKFLGLTLGTR
ncbi:MAG: hypothetical protein ABSH41_17515 [Syntrophobacteraceae bacterium]|jgi:hypothetical protein